MKTREEIVADISELGELRRKMGASPQMEMLAYQIASIELLLDIRDLLKKDTSV